MSKPNSAIKLPRDAMNTPVPLLTPKGTPKEATVTAGALISSAIVIEHPFVYIETSENVYFQFGGDSVEATALDFRLSKYASRTIPVPEGATHLSFFGGSADANIYVEQQG